MIEVTTLAEFQSEVIQYGDKDNRYFRAYFRGHGNAAWKLIPKVGRPEFIGAAQHERIFFQAWCRAACAHLPLSAATDWDRLAIAQHHGLATRLMDWSTNPLVACFFAVKGDSFDDCAVHVAKFSRVLNPTRELDPLNVKRDGIFRPNRVVPRITQQAGFFSVHRDPSKELIVDRESCIYLDKVVIPGKARHRIQRELSFFGVNASTLFPDLDGLAQYFNWGARGGDPWDNPDMPEEQAPAA